MYTVILWTMADFFFFFFVAMNGKKYASGAKGRL